MVENNITVEDDFMRYLLRIKVMILTRTGCSFLSGTAFFSASAICTVSLCSIPVSYTHLCFTVVKSKFFYFFSYEFSLMQLVTLDFYIFHEIK